MKVSAEITMRRRQSRFGQDAAMVPVASRQAQLIAGRASRASRRRNAGDARQDVLGSVRFKVGRGNDGRNKDGQGDLP